MDLAYFTLIDRVTALDLNARKITAEAIVPRESTIFEGHFPGQPLMPGVLLIESMAQTSGWLLLALLDFHRMPFLAAVKEAKLRTFVLPGETLTIDAALDHDGSGFAMTDVSARVEGKVVCSGKLTFRHVPFPNDKFRAHMNVVAKRLQVPQPSATHA